MQMMPLPLPRPRTLRNRNRLRHNNHLVRIPALGPIRRRHSPRLHDRHHGLGRDRRSPVGGVHLHCVGRATRGGRRSGGGRRGGGGGGGLVEGAGGDGAAVGLIEGGVRAAGCGAGVREGGDDGAGAVGCGARGARYLIAGYGGGAGGVAGAGLDGDVAREAGAGAVFVLGDEGGGHGREGAGGHRGRRLDVEQGAVGRDAGAAGVVADAVVGGLGKEVVFPGGDEVAVVAVAWRRKTD